MKLGGVLPTVPCGPHQPAYFGKKVVNSFIKPLKGSEASLRGFEGGIAPISLQ